MTPSSSSTLRPDLATSSVLMQQPARLAKHVVQHGFGEPARLRVLTARVVGGDHQGCDWRRCAEAVHRTVLEARPRTGQCCAVLCGQTQVRCKGDLAQRHHDAGAAQQREFLPQITGTIRDFLPRGLVVGRRAANCRRDERILQLKPVVAVLGRGLRGEPGAVERSYQPLAGTVAGEHAPSAVAAVSRWSKSQDYQLCVGITEARERFAPVLPLPELPLLSPRHLLAISHETWTLPAGDDSVIQLLKLGYHRYHRFSPERAAPAATRECDGRRPECLRRIPNPGSLIP